MREYSWGLEYRLLSKPGYYKLKPMEPLMQGSMMSCGEVRLQRSLILFVCLIAIRKHRVARLIIVGLQHWLIVDLCLVSHQCWCKRECLQWMLVVVAVVVGAGACSSLLLNVVFMLPSFLAFTSESMNQSSSIFFRIDLTCRWKT